MKPVFMKKYMGIGLVRQGKRKHDIFGVRLDYGVQDREKWVYSARERRCTRFQFSLLAGQKAGFV
jgi:hypothetical protein